MTYAEILIGWYTVNKRDLPWRRTTNPYFIWLSEIILQQTKVDQGLPYYNAFIAKYPTVFELADATETEVLKLWQGLGYYSRARNLHATAKHIVNNLDGVFPNNYKALLQLKGVGDYTASAIASICFNEVCAVVDGNVYRALSRYYGIHTPINTTIGSKEFKALAQKLIATKDPAIFNQAIMEFGAKQCKPKNPNCTICPLQNKCIAFKDALIEELPVKIKSNAPKKKYFNFLVYIYKDKKILLEKRKTKGIWQNLYQFPLIESDSILNKEALQLLLKNNNTATNNLLSLALYNTKPIIHKLSHQHLYTKFWIVQVNAINAKAIPILQLKDYPVPVLISNFLNEFNFKKEHLREFD
ncbi:MAG: A/G-specific adenine glycosylase [Oceanihabitans sp.]